MTDPQSEGLPEARLTARQRGWLRHLRACERSGETIKAYARREGLSLQTLYQAGKRLRRLGVLEPRTPRRRKVPVSGFVRVEAAATGRGPGAAWRIRLPSGVVFECNAPLEHADLLSLLSVLAASR